MTKTTVTTLSKVLFSRKSDCYQTPAWLYNQLDQEFDFDLDPCTTADNPLGTRHFYTTEDNGLSKKWFGNVYCNPPYSEGAKWIQKAYEENMKSGLSIVMLLPARTDTLAFHQFIYKNPRVQIKFLKGRIRFENTKYPAPFPSMVVIFL